MTSADCVPTKRLDIRRQPTKTSARTAVAKALKLGSIVRPDRCAECSATCKPQAHHRDYATPLDVEWLCVKCHRGRHRDRSGQAAYPDTVEFELLKRLSKKLGVTQAGVLRMAIRRLAEAEKVNAERGNVEGGE